MNNRVFCLWEQNKVSSLLLAGVIKSYQSKAYTTVQDMNRPKRSLKHSCTAKFGLISPQYSNVLSFCFCEIHELEPKCL